MIYVRTCPLSPSDPLAGHRLILFIVLPAGTPPGVAQACTNLSGRGGGERGGAAASRDPFTLLKTDLAMPKFPTVSAFQSFQTMQNLDS